MTFGDFKQFLHDCLAVQLLESKEKSHEETMQTLYAGQRYQDYVNKELIRLVAVTNFSKVFDIEDNIVKKPLIKKDGIDQQRIMDIIFEQQMVQVILKMDKWRIYQWYKEVLVVDNNSIVDYYGQR